MKFAGIESLWMGKIFNDFRGWFKGSRSSGFNAQGVAGAAAMDFILPDGEQSNGAFSSGGSPVSPEMVTRIKKAYRAASQPSRGAGESMWAEIGQRNAPVHEVLMADDNRMDSILSNPGQSDLFFGFHSLFASRTSELLGAGAGKRQSATNAILGEFFKLRQALGLRRIRNPEADQAPISFGDVETALREMDEFFAVRIQFPNPFPDEFGLATSRGIASYRAIHALYQAHRLRQLAAVYGPRILEIGAGMGRTMGYAHGFGLRESTIVDLPMTNVAQASFLAQTLGPSAVSLTGEPAAPGAIRILTPEWLRDSGETFDIVLNVDSLTEMDRSFADEYAGFIRNHAKAFLSINHDANSFRVCDLAPLKSMSAQRFPYWMREGYTEEIFFRP